MDFLFLRVALSIHCHLSESLILWSWLLLLWPMEGFYKKVFSEKFCSETIYKQKKLPISVTTAAVVLFMSSICFSAGEPYIAIGAIAIDLLNLEINEK